MRALPSLAFYNTLSLMQSARGNRLERAALTRAEGAPCCRFLCVHRSCWWLDAVSGNPMPEV